jgi:transcriptional regulator with GAF, ATPase, and Fis domain
MNIKRFFEHYSVKPALSTLILIIPLVIGLWNNLDIYVKAGLVLVIALLNIIFVYYDIKKPVWSIDKMLELMVKSLWRSGEEASHFRSNVMVYDPKKNKLIIRSSYNMMGMRDRSISLEPGQGCAGNCYQTGVPFWVDITEIGAHVKYSIDPKNIWEKMKSVMSVPIFEGDKIIGVLNIDTDLDLVTSGLNEEKVYNVVSAYSDLIATLL